MNEIGVVYIEKAKNVRILGRSIFKKLHGIITSLVVSRVLKIDKSNEHWLPEKLLDSI
jgi:hypothetical protein